MTVRMVARRRAFTPAFNLFLVGGAALLGHQVVTGGPMLRISAAVGVMLLIGFPAIERPRTAMAVLFAWLPFLGLTRRALISSAGWSSLDPLLLVPTVVTIAIVLTLMLSRKAILGGTPLAMLVFSYIVLGLIELFNPLQGGPLVALTGVMFILVPMSVFIIARTIADEAYARKIQTIILVTGVITALWGLKQVYIGFTGFERQWLDCCGYGALTINKTVRPFSTFSNAVEFAAYMGFGISVCYSMLLYAKGKVRILLLAAGGLMAYAGFLVGSRGFVIGTLLALFVLTGLRVKSRLGTMIIVLLLAGLAVGWSATRSANIDPEVKQGHDQLVQQQSGALSDPFDERVSSLPGHIKRLREGVYFAVTQHPAGLGTGAITRGGAKFGGEGIEASTELDFGNAFLAFGIVGGILYILIVGTSFRQLYVLRRKLASPVWAAVLGMGILSIGQWQNGGAYALTSMIWFMMGAADRAYMDRPRDPKGIPAPAREEVPV